MESVGKLPMQKNSNKLYRYLYTDKLYKEVECSYPVFKCGLHTGLPSKEDYGKGGRVTASNYLQNT